MKKALGILIVIAAAAASWWWWRNRPSSSSSSSSSSTGSTSAADSPPFNLNVTPAAIPAKPDTTGNALATLAAALTSGNAAGSFTLTTPDAVVTFAGENEVARRAAASSEFSRLAPVQKAYFNTFDEFYGALTDPGYVGLYPITINQIRNKLRI